MESPKASLDDRDQSIVHGAVSHTPGPWTVKRHVDTVTGESYKTLYESHVSIEPDVCAIWAPPLNQEREANAQLIAAAPDMLEVLRMVSEYGKSGETEENVYDFVDAVIRKATGEVV